MRIFVISDTHFGHANIIRYCSRPFGSTAEMDDFMITMWNHTVGPDDIVIHCGDFALGRKEAIEDYARALNGYKLLIRGNHDHASLNWYKEHGFDACVNEVQNGMKFHLDDCIFVHHPDIAVYMAAKMDNLCYKWFFGHVHDAICDMDGLDDAMCVCCERLNFIPLDITDYLTEEGKAELYALLGL